jgi:hypothetical protein
LHVLSLPPAFVLSQDQTLKLNRESIWQSLRKLTEHTRNDCSRSHRMALKKRSVAEVSQSDRLSTISTVSRQSARTPSPTLLFLPMKMSKSGGCHRQPDRFTRRRQIRPTEAGWPMARSGNVETASSPQCLGGDAVVDGADIGGGRPGCQHRQ